MIDELIAVRGGLERPLTVEENTFLSRSFVNGATRTQVAALIARFAGDFEGAAHAGEERRVS